MSSIFTRIIKGEIPSYKVAETEDYLAFLDINPLQQGHTLVIPKIEVDNLFDLQEDTYIGLMLFAKIVAEAMQKAISCNRVGIAVVGLEVPHAHIHLVPINGVHDIDFGKPRVKMSPEVFAEITKKIQKFIPGS